MQRNGLKRGGANDQEGMAREMLGLDPHLGHVSAARNGWLRRALARVQHDSHLAHLKDDGPHQERALARL